MRYAAGVASTRFFLRNYNMNITIPCETPNEISDGYHTFGELYDHRVHLFLALMKLKPSVSWFSRKHSDGEEWDGWFIAGMELPCGKISYHINSRYWPAAQKTGARELEVGIEWDGHTSEDVLFRLMSFILS